MNQSHPKFTVDTHLFRELGELLVGRDSTALVELIKNAYDADARHVIVDGRRLDEPDAGVITVSDDGVGMTQQEFEEGFLRVASRLKESGERRSRRYGRRFTGAKGIGRLAAHKLARLLEIESTPGSANTRRGDTIHAAIDWDQVEAQGTLDQLEGTGAITLHVEPRKGARTPGTVVQLRRLRRKWTDAERARFFAEVESFNAPKTLIDIPSSVVSKGLLFDRPLLRDTTNAEDPGFDVELTGELEGGDEYWQSLAQAAHWLIEIDAPRHAKVAYRIAPTRAGREEFGDTRPQTFRMPHPDPANGPFFQSRILIREGAAKNPEERAWMHRASGVRVYMEGFRVLPYGEPSDDWLAIDSDYGKRQRTLDALAESRFLEVQQTKTKGSSA